MEYPLLVNKYVILQSLEELNSRAENAKVSLKVFEVSTTFAIFVKIFVTYILGDYPSQLCHCLLKFTYFNLIVYSVTEN